MRLFGFFKKKLADPESVPLTTTAESYVPAKEAKLTEHSKKELMVQRVTLQDMEQFASLPFVWNSEIKKIIGPSTQPFAFMDIIGPNVQTACLELEKMNEQLFEAHLFTPLLPLSATTIPIENIIFSPRKGKSYSKIICTPHTFTGRLSKYPVSLLFMTDFVVDCDSTHGELTYNQSGEIAKAKVCCWRRGRGFFFFYKTINGHLALDRIETCAPHYENGEHKTIYKYQ